MNLRDDILKAMYTDGDDQGKLEAIQRILQMSAQDETDMYSPQFAKDLAFSKDDSMMGGAAMEAPERAERGMEDREQELAALRETLKEMQRGQLSEKAYDLLSGMKRYRGP